ncbi:MAG: PDZ domain-containing protein [candidate division KSB1 bacterium]|nr:PDZ domain-containing protein [candidate division KSB1 bacterium]
MEKIHSSWLRVCLFALALALFFVSCGADRPYHQQNSDRDEQGWIGVYVENLTPELREELGVKERFGVVVSEVVEDSPAEKAGIKEDDVILKLDGRRIRKYQDLIREVRRKEPGQEIEVEIVRGKEYKTLKLKVGRRPKSSAYRFDFRLPDRSYFRFYGDYPTLGLKLQELNADLASYFGLKEHQGILITEVEPDSPGDEAGLKAGDIITKVDNETVELPEDVIDIFRDLKKGDKVEIEYLRKGQQQKTTLEVKRPRGRSYPRRFWQYQWLPEDYYRFEFDFDKDRWLDDLRDFTDRLQKQLRSNLKLREREINKFKGDMERFKEDMERFKQDLQEQSISTRRLMSI